MVNPILYSLRVDPEIMQEWRNWQTCRLQVPVVARSCGFKSHLLHLHKTAAGNIIVLLTFYGKSDILSRPSCDRDHAGVAELADAQASGACGRKIVWVQVPSPAFFHVRFFTFS